MIEIHLLAMESFIFVLFILALNKMLKLYKEHKNQIYVAIIIYIAAIMGSTVFNLITYLTDLSLDITIAGGIQIGILFAFILFTIQVEFILYLAKLKKLYSLPFVVNFFLIIGLIMDPNMTAFIVYATVVGLGLPYLLIREGRKNRNGLAVGMGLFFFAWGLGQIIPIDIVFQSLKILGTVFFFLATQGFFDKYIVVDQEEEKKIMGTWISKLVVSE
ncbi:MAG: hypothetical protein ACFE8L_11300 [Candidatus Hodarchaeota archaeon]